jgi:hypothetical protein
VSAGFLPFLPCSNSPAAVDAFSPTTCPVCLTALRFWAYCCSDAVATGRTAYATFKDVKALEITLLLSVCMASRNHPTVTFICAVEVFVQSGCAGVFNCYL